jgi:hypothetical protein
MDISGSYNIDSVYDLQFENKCLHVGQYRRLGLGGVCSERELIENSNVGAYYFFSEFFLSYALLPSSLNRHDVGAARLHRAPIPTNWIQMTDVNLLIIFKIFFSLSFNSFDRYTL